MCHKAEHTHSRTPREFPQVIISCWSLNTSHWMVSLITTPVLNICLRARSHLKGTSNGLQSFKIILQLKKTKTLKPGSWGTLFSHPTIPASQNPFIKDKLRQESQLTKQNNSSLSSPPTPAHQPTRTHTCTFASAGGNSCSAHNYYLGFKMQIRVYGPKSAARCSNICPHTQTNQISMVPSRKRQTKPVLYEN